MIAHYTTHLAEASTLARVSWSLDAAGEVNGFRVGRMRCDSPLRSLGFEPGDVVLAINDTRVKSLPGALAAVAALRTRDHLRVHLLRKGAPLELRFRVV